MTTAPTTVSARRGSGARSGEPPAAGGRAHTSCTSPTTSIPTFPRTRCSALSTSWCAEGRWAPSARQLHRRAAGRGTRALRAGTATSGCRTGSRSSSGATANSSSRSATSTASVHAVQPARRRLAHRQAVPPRRASLPAGSRMTLRRRAARDTGPTRRSMRSKLVFERVAARLDGCTRNRPPPRDRRHGSQPSRLQHLAPVSEALGVTLDDDERDALEKDLPLSVPCWARTMCGRRWTCPGASRRWRECSRRLPAARSGCRSARSSACPTRPCSGSA